MQVGQEPGAVEHRGFPSLVSEIFNEKSGPTAVQVKSVLSIVVQL